MSYCTRQDMVRRFGEEELIQLTDRDRLGIIDDNVLNSAIADADAEIDGYLAGRYQLPLSTVPTTLSRIGCDIARYYLYDDAVTEAVTKRYDDARSFLKSVARGDVSLGVSSQGSPAPASNVAAMESGGRVFGRDDNGFV